MCPPPRGRPNTTFGIPCQSNICKLTAARGTIFGWESRTLTSSKGHFTHKTSSRWPSHFKHSHWWESQVKFASHYAWGTNGACEGKMDVKSTWTTTRHRMECVSWSLGIFFKNHLLEVGLTQNQERPRHSKRSQPLIYPIFIMCEDMHENKFIQNNCWSRAWSHTTSQYTWVTTQNDFGGVLWRPLSHFHLGSHNSMGTALGLRWSDPLGPLHTQAWRPMTIAI